MQRCRFRLNERHGQPSAEGHTPSLPRMGALKLVTKRQWWVVTSRRGAPSNGLRKTLPTLSSSRAT